MMRMPGMIDPSAHRAGGETAPAYQAALAEWERALHALDAAIVDAQAMRGDATTVATCRANVERARRAADAELARMRSE
jgi:uncharacterized protein YukE